MNSNKKLVASVVMVLGLMVGAAAWADDHGSRVVQPGGELFGKTYNELVDEWTNWFIKEPIATNPAFDPDGRFCDLNQRGKVWFLASTFQGVAERTCEIPGGKAIFLSLGGAAVSFAPDFPAAGDPCLQMATELERVRCDVNNDVPVAPAIALAVTLDGQPVEDLFAFRAQSGPEGFTLNIEDPSFLTDLGITPGDRSTAVADGYFLFLKPLRPGRHTLELRMTNPDQSQTGVDYTLIVGE